MRAHRLLREAEELAATQERNRLAREIHDILGQELTGLKLEQMDVIELNEAFAAQGLAVLLDASTVMPGEDWSWDVNRTGINTFTAEASLPDGRPGPPDCS